MQEQCRQKLRQRMTRLKHNYPRNNKGYPCRRSWRGRSSQLFEQNKATNHSWKEKESKRSVTSSAYIYNRRSQYLSPAFDISNSDRLTSNIRRNPIPNDHQSQICQVNQVPSVGSEYRTKRFPSHTLILLTFLAAIRLRQSFFARQSWSRSLPQPVNRCCTKCCTPGTHGHGLRGTSCQNCRDPPIGN